MINSKKNITVAERKQRVNDLRKEHQPYFDKVGKSDALFIPKMAYRPQGKDELYISFFPSELEYEKDIYTEFVSIDYLSEDPKRTLYLIKHNPFWREEYEVITSSSGHSRHFIPVNELKHINDVSSRRLFTKVNTEAITAPPKIELAENSNGMKDLVQVLEDINYTLQSILRKMSR
jgi:hypothetical protein